MSTNTDGKLTKGYCIWDTKGVSGPPTPPDIIFQNPHEYFFRDPCHESSTTRCQDLLVHGPDPHYYFLFSFRPLGISNRIALTNLISYYVFLRAIPFQIPGGAIQYVPKICVWGGLKNVEGCPCKIMVSKVPFALPSGSQMD